MALVLAGAMLAGCAGDGSDNVFTTGALGTQQTAAAPEPKVDPLCVTLVSRIEGLRKEGVADKIEKASIKKYKMTLADLTKADQLTKANAEFQLRCSTIMPRPTTAQVSSTPAATATTAATTKRPPKPSADVAASTN
ncbi:MAG TPA: hypothetical protein VJ233_12385 [Hyphomicrobiaceae bacterium]|nr:hypothetical protein [Hyphomicrobiaceae bacterium]